MKTPLLSACLLVAACSAPPASVPTATPSAAPGQADVAHVAVDKALDSLTRRHFDTNGCTSASLERVSEADMAQLPQNPDHCRVLVAQKVNKSWFISVRPKPAAGQPAIEAQVTVSPGGEGVTHIDYMK